MRKIAKSGIRSVKKAQGGDTTSRKPTPDQLDAMNRQSYLNRIMNTSRPDTLSSPERKERADIILQKVRKAQESAPKQRKGGKTAAKVAKKGTKVAVTKKAKYGAVAKKASSKRSK